MCTVSIAGRDIGPGQPCFVIAEAGVNHNGDAALARRLVDAAAAAGADAIKFQTFRAERVASRAAPKAAYQLATTGADESQLDMLRRLELPAEAHRDLQAYCRERGVVFLSTPFDAASADLLAELDVPAFKIGSGEITNRPFLAYVAAKGKPVLLSTGMSYLAEVDAAVRVIHAAGNRQVIVLHCVSNYPADPADANLRAMETLRVALQVPVGYSDHTPGLEVALAAVALGACVLEKHLTLDRRLPGPDQRASLEPDELRALVAGVRQVEQAMGSGLKAPAPSETENRVIARRSLAVARDVQAGTVLAEDMLMGIRPATGLSPELAPHVLGRRVRRALAEGELLAWSDLE